MRTDRRTRAADRMRENAGCEVELSPGCLPSELRKLLGWRIDRRRKEIYEEQPSLLIIYIII